VPAAEIYTQGHGILHVYIRMGSARCATSYYQQLVPREKIYTQGHGVYIRDGIHGACTGYTSSLCHKGEIHRDMAFLHVYQNGIYTVHCCYYQQQCLRRNIHQGHSSHVA
jgi:hypothetical protein